MTSLVFQYLEHQVCATQVLGAFFDQQTLNIVSTQLTDIFIFSRYVSIYPNSKKQTKTLVH